MAWASPDFIGGVDVTDYIEPDSKQELARLRDIARTLLATGATILGLTAGFLLGKDVEFEDAYLLRWAWVLLGTSLWCNALLLIASEEGERFLPRCALSPLQRGGAVFFSVGITFLIFFGWVNI